MPRFKGGIGRTGKKHKKVANFDIHRLIKTMIKTELVKESSCSVHEAAATNEAELEEAAAVLPSATIDDTDDEEGEEESASLPHGAAAVAARESIALECQVPALSPPPPAPVPPPCVSPCKSTPYFVEVPEGTGVPPDWLAQVRSSQVVGRAIVAAQKLDDCTDWQRPWPAVEETSSGESEPEPEYDSEASSEIDEQAEVAAVHYRNAVRRVEKAFPHYTFLGSFGQVKGLPSRWMWHVRTIAGSV